MTRYVGNVTWLTLVWMSLWEDLAPGTVAAGMIVGLAVTLIVPPRTPQRPFALRPLATARFVAYFSYKLLEASAIVAWEIVTPRNRIREGIVAVPLRGTSDVLTTWVANAITLTPGTITLDVRQDPTELYVHVLHLRDIEAVRAEILHLEWLAIRAFGDAEARGALPPGGRAGDEHDTRPSQATEVIMEDER